MNHCQTTAQGLTETEAKRKYAPMTETIEPSDAVRLDELSSNDSSTFERRSQRFPSFSNACFFVGSILYLILAVWDVLLVNDESFRYSYWILSILAALSYLLDAVASCRHLGFLVAGSFGLGAIFDLLSSTFDSYWCGAAAVHVYLLHAAVAYGRTNTTRLERLGDGLFFVGSVLDVVNAYVYETRYWRREVYLNLVTTVLWWIDAVLYLVVEYQQEEVASERRAGDLEVSLLETPPPVEEQQVDQCDMRDDRTDVSL